jgi:hypothetical protein
MKTRKCEPSQNAAFHTENNVFHILTAFHLYWVFTLGCVYVPFGNNSVRLEIPLTAVLPGRTETEIFCAQLITVSAAWRNCDITVFPTEFTKPRYGCFEAHAGPSALRLRSVRHTGAALRFHQVNVSVLKSWKFSGCMWPANRML